MSKELTSAEKSRRTKLGNKTNEELIDIIIRKDDVGRRKENLIKALKINIQGLEKKCESLNSNITNIETEYDDLQKRNFAIIQVRENLKDEIKTLNTQLKDSEAQIDQLLKDIKKAFNSATKMFILGGIIGIIITEIVAHLF